MNLDDVLVVNFATDERTVALSEYCIKKLGFKNLVTIQSDDGFYGKFLEFAKIASNSDAHCFLRTDADRLLFSGTIDLVQKWFDDKTLKCVEGRCFDFLMNKYRGATPHLFSRQAMDELNNDHNLMPDSQKPESRFIENITENKKKGWAGIDTVTNLHDYEQRPAKVCNTIINRISRGHFHYLYDPRYVATLPPPYVKAFLHAQAYVSDHGEKARMDYIDFPNELFDVPGYEFNPVHEEDIAGLYEKYLAVYNSLS